MTQRKILYIEDDADSREMMADVLHQNGFKFLSASRGLEGIRIGAVPIISSSGIAGQR